MLERDDPRRWELAVRNSRLGLWDIDMVSGQTVFNECWAQMVGYRLEELEPTTVDTWRGLCHPEDLEASEAAVAEHVAGHTDFYDVEVRMRHRDGHWVWVHARGQVVEWAEDGSPLRMVGTHEDITDRVEREQALQEARSVFDNSLEGIIILDSDEVITSVNPAFTAITGWSREEVVGTRLDDIRTHASDPRETERLRGLARSAEGLRVQRDFRRSDETYIPMLMSINRVLDSQGVITGYVAQLSDIRERVSAERDRLDRALRYDQATGLPNRRGLLQHVEVELRSLRMHDHRGALVQVNLDRFGSISEAFGHEASELAIAVIADRLRDHLQPGDFLARYSGDEFVIVLTNVVNVTDAEDRARELLGALSDVCHVPGAGDLYITACAGTVLLPGEIVSPEVAIQRATAAMRAAKRVGPGSVQLYKEGAVADSRERVVRAGQIRQAWMDSEFRLEYQPIYAVDISTMLGVEALMRWESPILGPVPPSEFIPLAEDIGLITDLGNWALREATRQGAQWSYAGLDLSVSVNVAVQQLVSDGFIDVVTSALSESGFPANRLNLEMTESTLLNASGDVIELLAELGRLGIRISIDDFGTGYSSFAYLRQYSLDTLKIDRSFIEDLDHRPTARSIVAAIIDLGHHLGLTVLAEGVETDDQLATLHELGCDLFQGFLASPAIPAESLAELAAAGR